MGMLDYMIELIVREDEAFQSIDEGSFRQLLKFMRPSLQETDIPHCTKLHQEIVRRAYDIEQRVCNQLKDIPGKVSFTFDTWTSDAGDPFLSVTGHYLGWATADNAPNNFTGICTAAIDINSMPGLTEKWKPAQHYIRMPTLIWKMKDAINESLTSIDDIENDEDNDESDPDEVATLLSFADSVGKAQPRSNNDFSLSKQNWNKLELMHKVLKILPAQKQTFSSSQEPTVFRVVPVLEFLQETWENMADLPRFYEVEEVLRKGLTNLEKWYCKVTDVDAYFICLVLDPNIKTAYTEEKWKPEFHKAGMKRLGEVFDTYYITPTSPESTTSQKATTACVDAEHTQASPRDELKRYLESPLEKVENKHSGPSHYPTLARLTRNHLAIQGSATPSEHVFSSGGLTGVALRNRLTVEAFEALQLLKSAYQNGHINVGTEAEKHLETLWNCIDEDSDVL
ncbi:hypothetical protein D9615_009521 [Tricholomella constricta]|uniref:HAT C-terminal dimerisation domain-containing protein n=1 Tax=Tricholomella constricta TaxID=117010 RepID=A0A8H5LW86_9AGAR|nr:hypothetical protein D9615_009521 [Tricholomella constricta]